MQALVRRGVVAVKGSEPPSGTAPGRFDLDNVGAEVAKDPGAEEPALVGEVEHTVGSEQGGFG